MDFLIVYPPAPHVGRFPFFGSTVAEAAAEAAAALRTPDTRQFLAVRPDDDADDACAALERAGARVVSPAEAAAVLGGLDGNARGLILPDGLVFPPEEQLRGLVQAAGPAPLCIGGPPEAPEELAIAGLADILAPAVRADFEETSLALYRRMAQLNEPALHICRIAGAEDWTAVIRETRRRTADDFQEAGVLVEDPDTLWVDPGCKAEPGARIGASVRLSGNTSIAAGAVVESFCRLENTEVGPGARILSHSVLLDSSIGRDAKVGPFAHIRPNTRLEPESFAGSFVETKNTVLQRRAALPHLAYLGDADIGVRVNVGAGAITCNYDGRGKHRTVVEAGAFIGSNAILVAPVTIGRRAFVAAGSVIVEDVPEDGLAIARGRQAVKPGRGVGRFEGADEI